MLNADVWERNLTADAVLTAVVGKFKRVTFMIQQFPLSDLFNFRSFIKMKILDQNPPQLSDILQPGDPSQDLKLNLCGSEFGFLYCNSADVKLLPGEPMHGHH